MVYFAGNIIISLSTSILLLKWSLKRIKKQWSTNIHSLKKQIIESVESQYGLILSNISDYLNPEQKINLIANPTFPDITEAFLKKCSIQAFSPKIYNNTSSIIETFEKMERIISEYSENLSLMLNNSFEGFKNYNNKIFKLIFHAMRSAKSICKASQTILRMAKEQTLHNFINQFQHFSEKLVEYLLALKQIKAEVEKS